MTEIIVFIFSGIFIGIAAGLFGLGGGLVIVPVVSYSLIYFSNAPPNEAIIIGITTSLASMVITGAMAIFAHNKNKNINYKIIKTFIIGLILGSLLVGSMIKFIPGTLLKNLFIIYTFFIAYKIYNHEPNTNTSIFPSKLTTNFIGFCFSIISGLIGIGGATLFFPYLIKKHIPLKIAIGTSSALGFFIGLGASITIFISPSDLVTNIESTLGFIYLPAIFFLTIPSLFFVKLSADFLLKIPEQLINKLFSLLLAVIGISMLLN